MGGSLDWTGDGTASTPTVPEDPVNPHGQVTTKNIERFCTRSVREVPSTRACAPLHARPAPASPEGHDTTKCVGQCQQSGSVTDPNDAPRAVLGRTDQPHPGASQLPRLIRTRFVSDGENVFRARIDLVWFLFEEIIHLKSNFGWLTDKYFMFTTYLY